jgi:hypothetical protein
MEDRAVRLVAWLVLLFVLGLVLLIVWGIVRESA